MKKKPIDKLKELIFQEEDETILVEVLEYVKVLKASKIRALKPFTPAEWARLPRWRQVQILLISEFYYRFHLLKNWFSEQHEKGWLLSRKHPNG